jgi:hypothetical protein
MSYSTAIAQADSGDYVWIKKDGTYARTLQLSENLSGLGQSAAPIIFEGYNNIIGDGYLGYRGAGGYFELNTDNFPYIYYSGNTRLNVVGRNVYLRNLNITGAALSTASLVTLANANSFLESCRIINAPSTTTTIPSTIATQTTMATITDCDIGTFGSHIGAGVSASAAVRISRCRLLGNGGRSAIVSSNLAFIDGNFFYNITGIAINITSTVHTNSNTITNNTFFNCKNGVLEQITGSTSIPLFMNNLVYCNESLRPPINNYSTGSALVEGNVFLVTGNIFSNINDVTMAFYRNNYSGSINQPVFVDTGNNNYLLRPDFIAYNSGFPYQDLNISPPGAPLRSGFINPPKGRITNISRLIYNV